MKHLVPVVAAIVGMAALGLAQAAELDAYQINLHNGYAMVAFVGTTPAGYAKAQRLASRWEGRRHLGLGPQTIVAKAIDDTEGTARQQVRQLDVPQDAVDYVYVH